MNQRKQKPSQGPSDKSVAKTVVLYTKDRNKFPTLEAVAKRWEGKPGVHVRSVAELPAGTSLRDKYAAARALIIPRDPTWIALRQAGKAEFDQWAVEYSESYASMNKYYREYRRNWLVRKSINTLAYWTVKEGFDTILEATSQFKTPEEEQSFLENYAGLKAYVDQVNRQVELDKVLKHGVKWSKIIGHVGFEIERNAITPTRLVPLLADQLQPVVNRSWELKGFSYKGQGTTISNPFFTPEEVLYFANDDDGSYQGLSEVEPILKEVQLDDKIVREDLTEAATTLWAGQVLWMLDVDKLKPGTGEAEIQTIINNHVAMLLPGKSIATDSRWEPIVVDLKPDLDKLSNISDKMERRILGNFGVPRFMLNIEKELNRATAYAELEAFVEGPITDNQRWLKRELERQWYDPLTRDWLTRNKGLGKTEEAPLRLVHRWREIRSTDWFELVKAVAEAYAQGTGFIDQVKAYELLRDGTATKFDPKELEQKQNAIAAMAKGQ